MKEQKIATRAEKRRALKEKKLALVKYFPKYKAKFEKRLAYLKSKNLTK